MNQSMPVNQSTLVIPVWDLTCNLNSSQVGSEAAGRKQKRFGGVQAQHVNMAYGGRVRVENCINNLKTLALKS